MVPGYIQESLSLRIRPLGEGVVCTLSRSQNGVVPVYCVGLVGGMLLEPGRGIVWGSEQSSTTENSRVLFTELRLRFSHIVSESLVVVGVVGTEKAPSLTGELFTDAGHPFRAPHRRRLSKPVEQDTHHRY